VGISSPFGTSRVGEGTIPTIGDPDVMSDTTIGEARRKNDTHIGDPGERTIPTLVTPTYVERLHNRMETRYAQLQRQTTQATDN
jgi:hypothetical protein